MHVAYCNSYSFGCFLTLGAKVLGIAYLFRKNESSTGTKVPGNESSWHIHTGANVPGS